MATAGKVDFPDHMKNVHQDWLGTNGDGSLGDTVGASNSVVDLMVASIGSSPYSAMTAYDPDTSLDAMDTAVSGFDTLVATIDYEQDWEDAIDAAVAKLDGAVFDDTYVTSEVTAFGNELDDQIENIVLPRFKGGMRDVGAVMTSAFVVGQAIIEGMRNRDVAKFSADLRFKLNIQRNDFVYKGVETMLRDYMAKMEFEKSYMHYAIEAYRMRIVSEKEKKDTENSISVSDGRWDLETYQYGANLLASIGGGTMIPSGNDAPSKFQSGIGGALAGAAVGGAVGGGWGAAIGGVLGGIGGLLLTRTLGGKDTEGVCFSMLSFYVEDTYFWPKKTGL